MTARQRRAGSQLVELAKSKHAMVGSLKTANSIECLECDEKMKRQQYTLGGHPAGIIIDVCRGHGVWLDGGEMKCILEFIAMAPNRPSFPTASNPVRRKDFGPITHDRGLIDHFYDSMYYPDEERPEAARIMSIALRALRLLM